MLLGTFLENPYCGLSTLQVNTYDFVSAQVELWGTKSEENSVWNYLKLSQLNSLLKLY